MIRAIHQIEVTSRCNLACRYCPSPTLQRPKVDMSTENFFAALELAKKFYQAETQFELNLAGIGESTLHPEFPLFIRAAREMMPAMPLVFATNGLLFATLHEHVQKPRDASEATFVAKQAHARQILNALKESMKTGSVSVWVSMHRPELGGLAHDVLTQELGEKHVGFSVDPSLNADDWAGQVKWKRTYLSKITCQWLRDGKVMAMADGRITTCCLDSSGVGVIGHVAEPMDTWKPHVPYSLCKTCQQVLPEGMKA